MKEILIATTNANKILEYSKIFEKYGYKVKSLLDYPNIPEIEEPFNTFEENAAIKAKTISRLLNVDVISDDSGLCVDALNGAPGVHSARWAGSHRSYEGQNKKLLEKMQGKSNRSAHYKTVIAWASPNKETKLFTGIMELTVADKESETPGFSYDTVVKYNDVYVSEMSMEDKNKHSSRANAVNKLIELFK